MSFVRCTHTFEVQETEHGFTLVLSIIQINVAWWFGPIWRIYVSDIHDRILEGLLDRLANGATPIEAGR